MISPGGCLVPSQMAEKILAVKEMISVAGYPPKQVEKELAALYDPDGAMVEIEWECEVDVKRLLGLLLADGTKVQLAQDGADSEEDHSMEEDEGASGKEVKLFSKTTRPAAKKRKVEEEEKDDPMDIKDE